MNIVDEIKSRLSIEQVVGQYVQLKKAGRNFKACCPFHAEKTPSFVVSPDKGLAYCFGCHKGGDVIAFVQEIENVEFKEALRMLADRAGIDMPERSSQDGPVATKDQKSVLYEINEAACAFFQKQLTNPQTELAKRAAAYVKERGITDESVKKFRLGFSEDSFELLFNFLLKKGYSKEHILQAGLVAAKDTGASRVYDRFRSRLMFPIFAHNGRVVGFTGRILTDDKKQAKYVNTPETPVYHKGNIIYGFNLARTAIRSAHTIVLVEGNMDVIASHQAGVHNTVACSGTALTEHQAKRISRSADRIVLAMDTDDAGFEAMIRVIELLQPHDKDIRVAVIEGAKDPDELIKKDPEAWSHTVHNAVPYFSFILQKITPENPATMAIADKKKILERVMPILKGVRSNIEQDEYVRKLALMLNVDTASVYADMKRLAKNAVPQFKEQAPALKPVRKVKITLSHYFIGLMASHPYLLSSILENKQEIPFDEKENAVYLQLLSQYNNHAPNDGDVCIDITALPHADEVKIWALYAEHKNASLNEAELRIESQHLYKTLLEKHASRKRADIIRQLRLARERGDKKQANTLLQELQLHLNT